MDGLIISIFYDVDNFYKELNDSLEYYLLFCNQKSVSFELCSSLSLSEVMTICRRNSCIEISFVNSAILDVCDSHRIQQHKEVKILQANLAAYSFLSKKLSIQYKTAIFV